MLHEDTCKPQPRGIERRAALGVRAPFDGILRNNGERRYFCRREMGSLFMEPYGCGSFCALHIAAVGREVEVGLKNLPLRVMRFVAHRMPDLPKFSVGRICLQMEPHAGKLHGDRRRAGAPAADVGADGRANQRQQIKARVLIKVPVLIGDGGFNQFGVDRFEGRFNAENAVSGRYDAKEDVFSRVKHARKWNAFEERRRSFRGRAIFKNGVPAV